MQGEPTSGGGEPGEGREWLPPEPPGQRSGIAPADPGRGASPAQGEGSPPAQEPATSSGFEPPPAAPPSGGGAPPGSPPAPSAYGSAGQPPAGYAPPVWAGQPSGSGWQGPAPALQGPEPGNGAAVASLVLGIVSLALLLMSAGLSSIVSLGCAIAAIPFGRRGRKQVDEGQTRKHRGLAQAGFVMGIVGTILSLLATVFWVLLIALSEDFQREFEQEFDGGSGQGLDRSSRWALGAALMAPVARVLLG